MGGALSQAQLGWISDPIPIDKSGRAHGFSLEGANFAFRFGAEQNEKLRARDDLRQNMVNLRTSVYTPITLPPWDHISEMAKGIRGSKSERAFFKADRKDAYKQLLLDQEYANLTLVALWHPTSGQWFAFTRRVLLFGAVSAVIHYNCFAMIFSVLANKISGLPVFNYFGDFGSLVPDMIRKAGLQVFLGFTAVLGALMKGDKSQADRALAFLGFWGEFPGPDNDMILRISLPGPKKTKWAIITHDFASKGAISHMDLGKLIGGLSFAQTSVFGRFGRTLLRPLHDKLKQRPYVAKLSVDEVDILRWWV